MVINVQPNKEDRKILEIFKKDEQLNGIELLSRLKMYRATSSGNRTISFANQLAKRGYLLKTKNPNKKVKEIRMVHHYYRPRNVPTEEEITTDETVLYLYQITDKGLSFLKGASEDFIIKEDGLKFNSYNNAKRLMSDLRKFNVVIETQHGMFTGLFKPNGGEATYLILERHKFIITHQSFEKIEKVILHGDDEKETIEWFIDLTDTKENIEKARKFIKSEVALSIFSLNNGRIRDDEKWLDLPLYTNRPNRTECPGSIYKIVDVFEYFKNLVYSNDTITKKVFESNAMRYFWNKFNKSLDFNKINKKRLDKLKELEQVGSIML